ncbi:MAG TPA: hypothetical protein VKB46_18235, partial [Pyrinomonadaceae bacterium]|nr:hypothetical protein [Pyrinomonadaceae bacterium]
FDSYGPASRSRIMSLPRAGTWTALAQVEPNDADDLDIAWQTSPGDFTPRVPYRFDVTLLGVAIDSPSSLTLAEGSAQAIAVSARNKFGSFTGGLAPMAIGAARTTQLQLKSHEQKIFDIQVPEGSPLLTVETMSNSQDRNDIDFYLFDCTGKRCLPVIAVLNQGNLTRLRELNPKAGSWRLVIDASRVPTKGITIDLIDIVADLSLGNVSVADSTRVRKVGDAWTTTANVWLVKKPSSDRYPVALISVNARQGGIEVPIGLAVTPIKTAESK